MYLVEETLQQSEKGCFSYWPTYCWAEWDSLATFHGGAWSLSHREKQHCGNTWTILPLMLPCILAKTQVRCTIKNSKYSCVCINCAWKKKALKQGLCEVACLCKQMVVPLTCMDSAACFGQDQGNFRHHSNGLSGISSFNAVIVWFSLLWVML